MLLDVSKLITSNVLCGSVAILAIVDTGAAVTVISPELLAKAGFQLKAWTGPRILMANGTPASPVGSAEITVRHENGSAKGLAVVFKMEGIDLLLGNDFLKQFGRLQIE